MSREGNEEPIEEEFADLRALFERYPLAYAGYRISHIDRHSDDHRDNIASGTAEASEVPFLTSPLFPVILLGYLFIARLQHIIWRLIGLRKDSVTAADHLFSMTSSHGYRTYLSLDLASELHNRGCDVALLCSPGVADHRKEWEETGARTVTHRELHGRIPFHVSLRSVLRAVGVTITLIRGADVVSGFGQYTRYYNYVFLEHVKRDSVRPLINDETSVHAFSPMPYLITAASPSRVYVYQHGIQWPDGKLMMAAPFFVPLTYFVWADSWREHFRDYVHSKSRIVTAGSPWYDQLAERTEDTKPSYDVLLVGNAVGHHSKLPPSYKQMVQNVVSFCEEHGYSLAIKLHPLEESSQYEEYGWGHYVVPYEDIDTALLDARVSVTNTSSAFVESAVLGVPAVVADLGGRGLSSLSPVDNVRFTDGPAVTDALSSALDDPSTFSSNNASPMVRVEGSVERILSVVDE